MILIRKSRKLHAIAHIELVINSKSFVIAEIYKNSCYSKIGAERRNVSANKKSSDLVSRAQITRILAE